MYKTPKKFIIDKKRTCGVALSYESRTCGIKNVKKKQKRKAGTINFFITIKNKYNNKKNPPFGGFNFFKLRLIKY